MKGILSTCKLSLRVSIAGLALILLPYPAQPQTNRPKSTQKAQAPKKVVPEKVSPAEEPSAPQLMSVSVVRVRPEMVREWINLNKNEIIPALKKAGVKERSIWQTAQFGESFEYVVITPIESLARFDDEPPLRKALGAQGYESYLEKARKIVTAVHTFADQGRMDLSYLGRISGTPKFAVVATVQVAPGRTQDFENLIKAEVLPAVKKADAQSYFVSQTLLGGDISEYTTVTLYDSFADIGKGSPILKGMGQAGYERFLRKTSGIVVRAERSVYRYNEELSFGPEGPPSK